MKHNILNASAPRAVSVKVGADEADLELAMVIWLNSLLAEARALGLIFGHFQLQLQRDGDNGHGTAWGEPWR